jgi:hypothetical protein
LKVERRRINKSPFSWGKNEEKRMKEDKIERSVRKKTERKEKKRVKEV